MCKDDGAKDATTKSTSESSPWTGAVPYINKGLSAASGLYDTGGPAYYPGQTFAGSNNVLQAGIHDLGNIGDDYSGVRNVASGAVTGIANGSAGDNPATSFFSGLTRGDSSIPGLDTLGKYARGDYLSAENPYFSEMADSVRAKVLPSINGAFSQAERGISGMAGRAQGEGLGDAIGALAYDNYKTGQDRQTGAATTLANLATTGGTNLSSIFQNNNSQRLQAASMAPSIQNMGINAGNARLLAGTTQQGLEQGQLDDWKQRYDYNQGLPFTNLQNYINNITAQTRGTGSTASSGTGTPAQPSYWNQALSAGLGAASFFV
jgi:hypothetical protein